MKPIKIIIEISGGTLQAVYSNTPLQYILIDYDNISQGEPPVKSPLEPDTISPDLYPLYDRDTPVGAEIREELKRIKF